MIDGTSRNELAQLLRLVAAGTITPRQFADEFESWGLETNDKAVTNIAWGGPGVIEIPRSRWTRRLRGRDRLSDAVRQRIAIAVLLLHSDYEYEWPEEESSVLGGDCLLMAVFLLLLVLGMFATIFWQLGQVFPWVAAACFALAVYVFYFSNVRVEKARAQWLDSCQQLGDLEAWPFFRQTDLEEARRHPRLMKGNEVP